MQVEHCLNPATGFAQLTPRLLSGTFRDFQRLKLQYDELLSSFAFNFNPRPSTEACFQAAATLRDAALRDWAAGTLWDAFSFSSLTSA